MTDTTPTDTARTDTARFVDPVTTTDTSPPWDPIVIPRADLDAEAARLAEVSPGADGRRRSLVLHPRSTGPGWGFAPGIQVAIEVLRPGEASPVVRHNSTQVVFCLAGSGVVEVNGRARSFGRHDVWNTPSMACYRHINDGDEVQIRLVYSNAALLKMLRVHLEEIEPPLTDTDTDTDTDTGIDTDRTSDSVADGGRQAPAAELAAGDEVLSLDDGAQLMTYERLVNPPVQSSPALLWRWPAVKAHLDELAALGQAYRGRRLYLLYNPATGRTNGTTHNFFATMTMRPANIVDRPHRHTAAAINYYFGGHGWSRVNGKRYEWSAGDLMLSAPGWAVHHHASGDETVYELTVQDSPLNLAMDSLLWQEDLKGPPTLIGSHVGFATNRAGVRS